MKKSVIKTVVLRHEETETNGTAQIREKQFMVGMEI